MITIIAGSRKINDYIFIKRIIQMAPFTIRHIISGGADGVDGCGISWAREMHLPFTIYPADWKRYGKPAGPIRNQIMADISDALIAVWDKQSPGTKNMIERFSRTPYDVETRIWEGPDNEIRVFYMWKKDK